MTVDDAFVRESTTNLRRLSNGLVAVERDPDDEERLAELFRIAHSLKGNCAAAGLDDAASLAHAVEDVLDAVRRDELRPTGELIDDALAAVDDLEAFVVAAGEGRRPDVDVEARVRALRDRLEGAAAEVDVGSDEASGGDDDAPAEPSRDLEFPDVPDEAQDISPEEALDRASVFDDIDDLLEEMDDEGLEDREFGSAGTFDDFVDDEPPLDAPEPEGGDVVEESGDATGSPGPGEDVESAASVESPEEPAGPDAVEGEADVDVDADGDDGAGSIDQSGHVGGVFDQMKSAVEEDDDVETLQSELEDLRFGEFDEDDDVTIQQLIEGDLGEEDLGEGSATDEDPFAVDDEGPSVDDLVAGDADVGGEPEPEPATTEPTEPTGTAAPDAVPEPTPAPGPEPRAPDADAEPVVTARTPTPRSLSTEATPAVRPLDAPVPRTMPADLRSVVARSVPDPRSLAADATRAISPLEGPEPRAVADDAVPAVMPALDAEPRALETGLDAAVTPSPRSFDPDVDRVVEPAVDPVEPLAVPADDEGGEGVIAGGTESVDDGGFEWADADEPSADAEPDVDELADVDADGPSDVEPPELPDLDEVDLGLDLDADATAVDAGDAAGAGDVVEGGEDALPDLDELDLDLDAGEDAVGEVEGSMAGFEDDETAAFESRFADAFADAAEDAASATAASTVDAATTIEGSVLDASRFGGDASPVAHEESASAGSSRVQSLTIDVERADELLTLAESLTVSRLKLERSIEPEDEAVEEALSSIGSVASSFRRTVMDIRLMPLRTAVETLPRVVRDVAREAGKEVDFETEGTDVRLDRSVIDRVGDPLVHLVRNAVDHGIEPPEEREERGKSREGRVTLRAERVRDRVVVEIEDDGRGIDVDAIRARAVEEGVATAEEAEEMPDEAVYELLFESGFSTAPEVTEVSGRGVGMDVVDRVLRELDGTVEIESEPGAGTTVRLSLPVNVAMAELWFVAVGDERYGVPASAVEQIADASGTTTVDGRELFRPSPVGVADGGTAPRADGDGDGVGGDAPDLEPVELVRLHEAYDVSGEASPDPMVLRLRPDVREAALLVDDVLERQEVVVKPYGELLGGVPGVTGATLRGDGRLVNVVDAETVE